ncbi:hypothetical protein O6P43_029492 [Quillaja saponaria]|uniref:Uncharacterized protein n=1 Tax=Quillaja saponaria TaxID=32244 RepID=A0AAD7L1J1_QUISA|nr:hypothetical protein O6P43_029492 [Quillaja saponaria]
MLLGLGPLGLLFKPVDHLVLILLTKSNLRYFSFFTHPFKLEEPSPSLFLFIHKEEKRKIFFSHKQNTLKEEKGKKRKFISMALFSVLFSCFVVSSSSSRVSDDARSSKSKALSSDKSKNYKAKSSGAPIVASYFPVNSYVSRL